MTGCTNGKPYAENHLVIDIGDGWVYHIAVLEQKGKNMTIKLITGVAVAALLCAGCDKKDGKASAQTAGPDAAKVSAKSAPLPEPIDPNEVMVSVGDKKLTRGELDAEVEDITRRD